MTDEPVNRWAAFSDDELDCIDIALRAPKWAVGGDTARALETETVAEIKRRKA